MVPFVVHLHLTANLMGKAARGGEGSTGQRHLSLLLPSLAPTAQEDVQKPPKQSRDSTH